eukprot:scaffold382435_cov33-Prasinocladus_malaysianus.AAC.1
MEICEERAAVWVGNSLAVTWKLEGRNLPWKAPAPHGHGTDGVRGIQKVLEMHGRGICNTPSRLRKTSSARDSRGGCLVGLAESPPHEA